MTLTKKEIKEELSTIRAAIGFIASPKGNIETGEVDFEALINVLSNVKKDVRLFFEAELANASTEKQKEAITISAREFQKIATRISSKLESLKVIQRNALEFDAQANLILEGMNKLIKIFA